MSLTLSHAEPSIAGGGDYIELLPLGKRFTFMTPRYASTHQPKLNGPAAGAGLSLALACDLRIAAQSARLLTAFANVGFSGDFGGSYFLSKLVGTGKARELYYTAEPLDAADAVLLGIVNRVVPDADLVETTMLLARKLARGPHIALAMMKRNFNAAETSTLAQLLDLEVRHQIETGRTLDHQEAARAFVEKRTPIFVGR
jgi:2-(1,2-epoxy-1,2-dihydrophenyl)acetyl-CoA isomerase